uniref:zinc finger protein 771-like n=1 Tax=Podarcis muralis TaxID=64176 RepID=UPI00109EF449|nr:zinc finger protein 771-like [Podarcis muralis]XP_028558284.1 zinc finger protein 771-like [Podarcis muralis]XP_028558285.1 zinc finger protein 771-like [Podarcis muralis]
MVDVPSSPAHEADFSPCRIPENGSVGSELPVSLEDWNNGEKELDFAGSSVGHSRKKHFLCKDTTAATSKTEVRVAELQHSSLSSHKPQQCRKQGFVAQEVGRPIGSMEEAGPSHGRHLQSQGTCKKKGTAENGQEVRENLDAQAPCSDDVVQLINEDGVYSSAKLVPTTKVALLSCLPQRLEHCRGEDFEIREVIVDEKPFQCAICAKAFKRAWELFSHEVVHNEERPFCCQLCQASFKRHSDYKSHALVHTEERPHRCELCGKRFKRASNLAEHRRIHSGERPHRCTACTKRFKTPYELQRHMLTHCAERPFACTACGKGFAAAGALLLHQRQHCDDKPHVCGVCGKRFAYGHSLRVHERVHTGDRPFSCVLCGKAFSVQRAGLARAGAHGGAALCLRHVRQGLQAVLVPGHPRAVSHWRAPLRLRGVRQGLCTALTPPAAPARPQH